MTDAILKKLSAIRATVASALVAIDELEREVLAQPEEDIPGLEIPEDILSTPEPAPRPPRHGAYDLSDWHDTYANVDESPVPAALAAEQPAVRPRPPRLPGRVPGGPSVKVDPISKEVRPDPDDEAADIPDLEIPEGILSTPDPAPRPPRHGAYDLSDWHDPYGHVDESPDPAALAAEQPAVRPRPPRLPGRVPGGPTVKVEPIRKEVRPDADSEAADIQQPEEDIPGLEIPEGILSTPDPAPRPPRNGDFDDSDWDDPYTHVDETPDPAAMAAAPTPIRPRPPRIPGRFPGAPPLKTKPVDKEVRPDDDAEFGDIQQPSEPPPAPAKPASLYPLRRPPLRPKPMRPEPAESEGGKTLSPEDEIPF
jgi:hypothetical protein